MKKRKIIPLVDLANEYLKHRKDIDQAIKAVLESGLFILGKNVVEFEKEFASYLGVKYGVGVASGTDALILALRSLSIREDDEVILPANSYPTAFAVASVPARIKLVDIDPLTLNLDPKKLEKAITKKTKVILPIHLYGQAADLEPIGKIAQRYNLAVVEDCAQAHGAFYQGKRVGSLGDAGCFSFYPTKNLGAFGDAGMVVTNNKAIADKIRQLRMYGEKKRYQSLSLGTNSRFDELQAAILKVKLKFLDRENKLRQKIAQEYLKNLNGLDLLLPNPKNWQSHVFHIFAIQSKKKKRLENYLEAHGVITGTYSQVPFYLMEPFRFLGYQKGDFPQAKKALRGTLFLPCYPHLKLEDVDYICNLIRDALK